MEHTELVGLYFAVIHKATISRFTVTKTILMTFANPFYKRTMHGRVQNKPSPLWAVGNALTWPAKVLRCTWCHIQYCCFKSVATHIPKRKMYIPPLSDETVCRLLPTVCTYEHDGQFVI
jgi:hypothetical protein